MNKIRSSRWCWVVLGSLAGVLACKPTRTTVPPLCAFNTLSDEERDTKSLLPLTWMSLTSPSVDRETMSRNGALTSACGQVHEPALAPETFACPGFDIATTRVPGDVVEETDLVINAAGDDRMLLWAATDELTSGEAEGAAALALWAEDGLEVHAVGVLRAYREAARMRLHSIEGTPVLVLQSDLCTAGGRCVPVGQVVPIINRRLQELPLWEAGTGCIGRAQFELEKREERPLGDGWTRRFSLIRSLELEETGIMVTDLVRMEDYQPDAPDVPARPYRRLTSKRPLVLRADRLELEDEDLWERALRDDGDVDPDRLGADAG